MKKEMFRAFTNSIVLIFIILTTSYAQVLKPGFDKEEYMELMKVSARFGDTTYSNAIAKPQQYDFVYRSPVIGLENRWDLWVNKQHSVGVISIRGTAASSVSWLANFYSAMVPAKGELEISAKEKFVYELASNPKAAVHVGWLVSTAFLSKDILPKIDSCYKKGIKDMLIMGHSQGGGIAYLMTAYLYSLQKNKQLPEDIRFKTYCSAGPKPGNLFFAYEYEAMTQNGWAYNVVNSADWVPEVPLSVQTIYDFNTTNLFANARGIIRKQKFFQRIALNYMYNRLSKPSLKAQKRYQNYLGKMAYKLVKKNLNGYISPEYYSSNNYVRTGSIIVLLADEEYYKVYPDSKDKVFVHHFHGPYMYLTEKLTWNHHSTATDSLSLASLNGTWELNYISGVKIAFDSLYLNQKPAITVNTNDHTIVGNNSCNSFRGKFTIKDQTIRFPDTFVMTRMFCEGGGEQVFMDALKKMNKYTISANMLTFYMNEVSIMRFTRKL
ncbi:lipase family protein [Xanthocytophaga agilis]|uniref:META domain-containing protein n=1 Tax=Xanthocytophaga agilis TaxID=3048010 RepID=A0AAE3R976_9BACT|nr:META domain-containing protein [Xanthocytophaga agilis]MDJ1506186.1 META domain-containing protein [Xanthocytophaga agilis]